MAPKQEGTQFIIHLQGIKLPPETEAEIAKEVRSVTLRELARIDLRGDFAVRIPRKDWIGLWLERAASIDLPMPGPFR